MISRIELVVRIICDLMASRKAIFVSTMHCDLWGPLGSVLCLNKHSALLCSNNPRQMCSETISSPH